MTIAELREHLVSAKNQDAEVICGELNQNKYFWVHGIGKLPPSNTPSEKEYSTVVLFLSNQSFEIVRD